MTLATQICYFK